ncbi:MAG: FAD-binding oxidoreductase, partial [Acidobacteria bacterium]|nr:FAD-binding oxidoreductase [Acidobacteriota bacterium]
MFEYLVIGKGMMGAAAARYLSSWSDNVALVGPSEPEQWQTHDGVFSSHYDSGRITRVTDKTYLWGKLAQQSIAKYREIEQRSGIRFHFPTGGVIVGQPDYVEANATVGQQLGAEFSRYPAHQLPPNMCIQFPVGLDAVHETGPAGFIDPRKLVAAQIA